MMHRSWPNERSIIKRWTLLLGFWQVTVLFSLADEVTFGGQLERPSNEKVQSFLKEAQSALGDYSLPIPRSQSAKAQEKNRKTEASPADPAFSWRLLGMTTPARRQKLCASCYVFTAVAAMEANWALRNGEEIDASEQHVLNCLAAGSCSDGGLLSDAMTFLLHEGTTGEKDEPYQGGRFSCAAKPVRFKAKARAYVGNGGVPSDSELKSALLEHGPVAAFMYAAGLDAQAYFETNGVIADDQTTDGHFVLIVGWDDNKLHDKKQPARGRGAWEIKNSWGQKWGHKGFGWVAYGVRDIGDEAMWIECTDRKPKSVSDPFEKLKPLPLPESKTSPPVVDN